MAITNKVLCNLKFHGVVILLLDSNTPPTNQGCMNLHVIWLYSIIALCSSDVDALVAEIMAKEPLVTRSKADQVKGLIESEFNKISLVDT